VCHHGRSPDEKAEAPPAKTEAQEAEVEAPLMRALTPDSPVMANIASMLARAGAGKESADAQRWPEAVGS
jgi:hypothetical protein